MPSCTFFDVTGSASSGSCNGSSFSLSTRLLLSCVRLLRRGFLVLSLTAAGVTASCYHPRFQTQSQNQTKDLWPPKTEQGAATTRILGAMPIEEARPIQLGMTLLFSDQQNRAYTAAVAPLVNQAADKIRAKTSYHDLIEWTRDQRCVDQQDARFWFLPLRSARTRSRAHQDL